MSILLLAPSVRWGAAIIERLSGQGDDVRVVEPDRQRAEDWRRLGARLAPGSADDADLVERAALDCRTVVLCLEGGGEAASFMEATLSALAPTSIDRVVVVSVGVDRADFDGLRAQDRDYVLLHSPRARNRLWRREPAASLVAEAVDAADDLAGHPRLELDLADPSAGEALGLRRV